MDRTGDFATPEPKRRRVEGMASAFSSRKSSPGLSRPASASRQPNQHHQQSTLTPNSTIQDHIATPAKEEPVRIYQSAKMCQINDPIHGNISFEEVCRRIIDTKEFQRLRKLAQLGLCDRVYPGSTHSRFSHSLGVAHYAEAFLLYLIRHQPELNITPVDVLCVKIAGLCHDLGHGPFSHVFDGVFMSRARPEKKWHHEEWSVSIFRHLLQQNHINLQDYGLSEIDQLFIEEIILGTKDGDRQGRPHEKFYLYDVVNNTRSGLDVDKLDYFRRDIKHSHVQENCPDFERVLQLGRVCRAVPIHNNRNNNRSDKASTPSNWASSNNDNSSPLLSARGQHDDTNDEGYANDSTNNTPIAPHKDSDRRNNDNHAASSGISRPPYDYMICYPEKMVIEHFYLFQTRYKLHQLLYTHKSVKKVEFMYVDAFLAADPYIKIPGSVNFHFPDGMYRMSQCVEDPMALSNLSDQIVEVMRLSPSPELKKAKDIFDRVDRRDFYPCLGKTIYERDSHVDHQSTDEITAELVRLAQEILALGGDIDEISPSMRTDGDDQEEDEDADEMLIQERDSQLERPLIRGSILHRSDTVISTQTNGQIHLSVEDLIVEKMHIHYGLKQENPLSRLRFFPKASGPDVIAQPPKAASYRAHVPSVFEELAVRVFCRSRTKTEVYVKAFENWCRQRQVTSPVMGASQV